ncbi:MAG: ABC transporter ATP-binding protein, partial [Mailhella sp.]|nr:ABC transporter ATP-binding protein [Mailhella sp.]
NRLLLAKLFTKPANMLVLDEPTNDLDMETLELLEELLSGFKGTVIVVSHDRAFLDELVTGTIALEGDGKVREYVGGYTDWLRQRQKPEERKEAPAKAGWKDGAPKKRRLSYREQQEKAALLKEQEELPARLEALEAEQARLEEEIADPGLFSRDPDGFNARISRLPEVEEEQLALLERVDEIEARLRELDMTE